ncbi:MAG: glutamate--tRNA ligase family protein, partial [Propionibacteriaceae bacterium]|nr:glutamate--tRNA ligase family protein [Propionibacteriaceae bacterium]
PQFAHMPLLRNTDKSKISKRKNPAARLLWFREHGYLPEAVRNFLQLLGYPPSAEDAEVASFDEFVEHFSWDKVNTTGPIFDLKKLDWLNGHYIRTLSAEELADRIVEYAVAAGQLPEDFNPFHVARLRAAVPIIQERLTLLADAIPQLRFLLIEDEELVVEAESFAALREEAAAVLDATIDVVAELEPFRHDTLQAGLRASLVEGMGIKAKFAFAPARIAITGSRVSPPLFESMEILGRDSSLHRLKALRAAL